MTLVTPPTEYPVSLAEAKAQFRETSADEDATIARLISAAVAHLDAQGVLGRAMVTQTWSQAFHAPWARVFTKIPASALVSATYYDENNVSQSLTIGDYSILKHTDWSFICPNDGISWPTTYSRPDAITFVFTAGYGDPHDVPENIRHAILLLVTHWFENRTEAGENMSSIPFGFADLIGETKLSFYG